MTEGNKDLYSFASGIKKSTGICLGDSRAHAITHTALTTEQDHSQRFRQSNNGDSTNGLVKVAAAAW